MHVLDIFHRIRLYRHTTKQYYCTLKHMLPHCAPLCAPLTGKICKPLTLHSRHAGYGSATPTVPTCAMTPGGLHNAHAGSTHACMLREPLLPLLHCHCLPPHSAGVLQACARTPGRYRCCGCSDGRASLGWYVNAGQIPLPQCLANSLQSTQEVSTPSGAAPLPASPHGACTPCRPCMCLCSSQPHTMSDIHPHLSKGSRATSAAAEHPARGSGGQAAPAARQQLPLPKRPA
jgi:hypothetical protein